MNQFEDFLKKKSAPENREQFEENESTEKMLLIAQAIQKVEGVILLAPIPQEVKETLLQELEQIVIEEEQSLQYFFTKEARGMTNEQTAGLWVYRKIRDTVSATGSVIGRTEAGKLDDAISHMYTEPSVYADQLHEQWMNSKKPEQN